LIFFTADWCGDCAAAQRPLFGDLFVKKTLYDLYIPIRIDAEKDRTVATQFEITRLPTFILLDPKTKNVLHREESIPTDSQFDELLREHAAK
jgi:hypothetical protein